MSLSFRTLGITPETDLPVEVILSESFNGRLYGLDDEQIGKVRALRDIVSSYEKATACPGTRILRSSDAVRTLYPLLKNKAREEVAVLFLNADNRVIHSEIVYTGTVNCVNFSPREILAKALSANATGIIIAHNHPSGNPLPGSADIEQTKGLADACKVMDVNFLDHIIICSNSYYSFSEEKSFSVELTDSDEK